MIKLAVTSVLATMVALSLAACGGGGDSTAEGSPPTFAEVKTCLKQNGIELAPGEPINPGEANGIGENEGTVVIIVFKDGGEGEKAADELADEPGPEGSPRDVTTAFDGRIVVSLSNNYEAAEEQAAKECSGG